MSFRIHSRINGIAFGLTALVLALGCSTDRSAGPTQACFQGSAGGGLVCKTVQAMTQLTAPEPSTTPTQGEQDVDGDGKADAFLCKSADRNDDGVADIEETEGLEQASSEHDATESDADKDGVEDSQECEMMKERGQVDGDLDQDGVADSADPDDDNDGIADTQDADRDGDGIPDAEDTDTDDDGVPNLLDSK